MALAHLRSGETLVVWKLDRLGRSMAHLIETVRGLEKRGIGFRSLTEGVDTTTPGGTLIFHLFGALAHYAESGMMQSQAFHSASIAR
jgi:DNA invertase Pin-like site-specific DNA recombinase